MPGSNSDTVEALRRVKRELEQLKAEKLRLYPPNPHPLAEPDRYPSKFTSEQIAHRGQLIAQIERLEERIKELEAQM